METKKMSLATIKGKLSRDEMKNIIAGSGQQEFPGDCIEDGKSCPFTGRCCNECLATFKCGKK